MKVLIYCVCFAVFIVIEMLIDAAGIKIDLGPTLGPLVYAALFSIPFFVARWLCSVYDYYRSNKTKTPETVEGNSPKIIQKYLMTASNGMQVWVPEDRLEDWQKAQADQSPEAKQAREQPKEAILEKMHQLSAAARENSDNQEIPPSTEPTTGKCANTEVVWSQKIIAIAHSKEITHRKDAAKALFHKSLIMLSAAVILFTMGLSSNKWFVIPAALSVLIALIFGILACWNHNKAVDLQNELRKLSPQIDYQNIVARHSDKANVLQITKNMENYQKAQADQLKKTNAVSSANDTL